MFFRRRQPENPTFAQRLENLKTAGFSVEQVKEGVRVGRGAYVTVLQQAGDGARTVERAGILMGAEIGHLVDGGFQKFFRAASGRRKPALASDLKAIHDFEEDLKEALGQESYYNESLGTVSTYYLYDRLQGRDTGATPRPWDVR